jgi:hypothetical protein
VTKGRGCLGKILQCLASYNCRLATLVHINSHHVCCRTLALPNIDFVQLRPRTDGDGQQIRMLASLQLRDEQLERRKGCPSGHSGCDAETQLETIGPRAGRKDGHHIYCYSQKLLLLTLFFAPFALGMALAHQSRAVLIRPGHDCLPASSARSASFWPSLVARTAPRD